MGSEEKAVASDASGVAGTAVGSEEPITSERKVAKPSGVALATLGLRNQERIEVLWDVEMDDGADEKVWWGAVLQAEETHGEVGEAQLVYEAQHGFDVETRRVLFLGGRLLWDTALRDRLPYRREGEAGPELGEEGEEEAGEEEAVEEAVDPLFAVGASVKARFQGGETYCAGTVQMAHADGTYDILYEDHVLETNIPAEMIQAVDLAPSVAAALAEGGDVAAESTAQFFELFEQSLTSGPAFSALSAERQAIASEKVRQMRPHFEAELGALRDTRGWGATVTGEDIREMLPRVMARQRAAAVAAAASSE